MHINKRMRFAGAVFAFATLLVATAVWAAKAEDDEREASVVGAGRIGNPIRGTTIPSASDFGFAVSERGGTFVCSMAGPGTGGFSGFPGLLVEGAGTPGSPEIYERDGSFSGFAPIPPISRFEGAAQNGPGVGSLFVSGPPRPAGRGR